MRVAIVGSRDYPNLEHVDAYVESLPTDTVVVSGGARGVDTRAAARARERGLCVEEYLADWERFGRAAGMIRNKKVLDVCERVVAFWDGSSRGTAHTIREAIKRGLRVEVKGTSQ